MNTLVVVEAQGSCLSSWPNRYGLSFSTLENLNEGIRIVRSSFFPTYILLGGWKVYSNGSMISVHTGMARLVKEIYRDVAGKIVEAVYPNFDFGETPAEYYYWQAAVIALTAKKFSTNKAEIICGHSDYDCLVYLPIGLADYKVNEPWSNRLEFEYITPREV